MSKINQLQTYKKHLLDRYIKLIETSKEYQFIDEVKSDYAAYKAMKILGKINKVNYLDREHLNSTI